MSDSQLKAKTTENAALLNTTEPSKRGKFTAALVALALTGTIVLATSPNGTAALRRRKKIVDEQYPELDSRPRRRKHNPLGRMRPAGNHHPHRKNKHFRTLELAAVTY